MWRVPMMVGRWLFILVLVLEGLVASMDHGALCDTLPGIRPVINFRTRYAPGSGVLWRPTLVTYSHGQGWLQQPQLPASRGTTRLPEAVSCGLRDAVPNLGNPTA
jgi:hypothetical protein